MVMVDNILYAATTDESTQHLAAIIQHLSNAIHLMLTPRFL